MRFVCNKYPRLNMTYKPEIRREVNGVILKEPTQKLEFEGGYYETDDEKKIAFIKRHTDFGNGNICVDESEKYQGKAQKAPEASPEEKKIIEAASKKKGRPKKSV